MKKILLTGASGFVGSRYLAYSADKYQITPVSVKERLPSADELHGVDVVLHAGGLAHQMQWTAPERYFSANYDTTRALADLAKQCGVGHFIFISTIKVFGEANTGPLNENSPCLPVNDPYGESKLQAEKYLQTIASDSFVVTIIRPPLIYGPGVKGNLDRLLHLADTGYWLPFGGIHNRRTMIYLDNLVELINAAIDRKAGGIFLAADAKPLATSDLISQIRQCLGRPLRLFSLPGLFKKALLRFKPELGQRLFGSFEMDATQSYRRLAFYPPYPVEQGIRDMVEAYQSKKLNR
ncbi:MAG: NAD-dependent epimerase/dehydratase family protein [Chitinophagaceae bacterium]|nr:NAD-dependent epimerase/dehydratase family protein [Chitinophagaceae bacterium]